MNTGMPNDLASVFFGSYRRQVLGLLLLHPDEAFHLREIARITDTQPGTLRRELIRLEQAGVLRSERVGNLVRYRADPACPIYEELRAILKKTAGVVEVLRGALAPLGARIAVAFVYGSVAGGTERHPSDLDVLVVGEVSFEEVVAALLPCQETLRREINANVYGETEFREQAKRRGEFLSRVLEGPLLMIFGTADDIGKPGENRQHQGT
jgi:DNA-binding transcriptional ArsR family regulator